FYPYNTRGFPRLRDAVVDTMSPASRLHWRLRSSLRGDSAAVRRIPPRDFWRTRDMSRISTALVLERWSSEDPWIGETDASSFAHRCVHVLLDELDDVLVPLTLFNATHMPGDDPLVPSLSDYLHDVRETCRAGLDEVRLLHVRVPQRWNPVELGSFLFDALDW
ncbi:MAG: hypothetical protein ACODAA_08325, partial [Gemmatimonadota bacterium]